MSSLALRRHSATSIRRRLLLAARRQGHRNVFNPSIAVHAGSTWIAYRALPRGAEKPFRAYLLRLTPEGASTITDLTDVAGPLHAVVADPKLVVLDGGLYVTFNSGYVPVDRGSNAIHLMRVFPQSGAPQICELDGRQRIEKNWAFFMRPDGRLGAVYSASPLRELLLSSGELGADGPLGFEPAGFADPAESAPELTLGTQLLQDASGHLAIVHQKTDMGGRRQYVGRAARFTGLGTGKADVEISHVSLIHSRLAMRRQRSPHNPHLHSATYFAGLAHAESGLYLGYGVNDRHAHIARTNQEALWS